MKIFADDTEVISTINNIDDQIKLQLAIDSLHELTQVVTHIY